MVCVFGKQQGVDLWASLIRNVVISAVMFMTKPYSNIDARQWYWKHNVNIKEIVYYIATYIAV